jgi:hypothetical protein
MQPTFISVALGATLALSLASGADASGVVTPPADTPNLALMVIQPADLVPGATLGDQAYVKPPRGFTAQYASEFTSAATTDGVNYSLVLDYIALAPSTATSGALFASEQAFEQSRAGRRLVTKGIVRNAGKKAHLTARNIRFSGAQNAGVGTGSFEETITVARGRVSVQEVYLIFEEGTVCASLELVGELDKTVPETDATTLASAIDQHIKSVLATSGSTGAIGTT